MSTALIRRKEQKGLEHEQNAIKRIKKMTVYIMRGATTKNQIKHIDKAAFKKYIETEGYGE